jgi:phage tail sheath gpL-like
MASSGATGVAANNRIPAVFLSIAFGASQNGAGGGPLKCLLLGFKMSTGSGIADTTIYHCVNGLSDAQTFAGLDSMAYLMAQAAYTMAPAVDLYLGFPAEPILSGAKATCIINVGTVASTPATASGNVTVTIGGVPVTVGIASGQQAGTAVAGNPSIATAIANAINSSVNNLCVTAAAGLSSTQPIVTITFNHNGSLGNQVPVSVVAATTLGLTIALSGTAALTGGSGVESLSAILGVAAASEYDIVFACSQDSTNLGLLKTYLDTQYTATVGLPGQGIVCFNGSAASNTATNLSSAVALMSAINDPVVQVVFSNLPTTAFTLGAGWAAQRSVLEGADPTTVETLFNPAATDLSAISAAPSASSLYLTTTQIITCLNTGLTPIMTTSAGDNLIVRSITSHYQDASSNPDARTLDTIQVSVPFAFAKLIQSDFPQSFGKSTLVDNPAPGADKLPPGTVYPQFIQVHYHVIANGLAKQARPWITNVDADYANWVFNLDPTVPGRVDATMPITPVQWVVQFSAAIQQLTLL